MQIFKLLFASVIISLIFSSCASVDVTLTGEKREPKSKDYEMVVLNLDDNLTDNFVILGEIYVYDNGITIMCSFNTVLSKTIDKAREMGADAIKITEIIKPDMISSCYRIKSLALAYSKADNDSILTEAQATPLNSADLSFVSFNNCFTCADLGNINMFKKSNTNINLLSFFAFTVYIDGRHEGAHYPITESRIMPHFKMLLESYDWKVNYIGKKSENFESYLKYYSDLLTDILSGQGNPLEWGKDTSIDLKDTTSIIYIPFAVEREVNHNVQARFYVLIADSKGKIQFCRCFDFNPQIWSRDFNSFANDIEGRLPLAVE